jgi:S-adenosylmethionine:tRNA ribosyltransferase-isomerase
LAAPTAGLHFTRELMGELREIGVTFARLTLHVGLGTFRPVKTQRIEDHVMHSEFFHVGEEAARAIACAKESGNRVICVGTTALRAAESAALRSTTGSVEACEGNTDIFIRPGCEFRVANGLITNFHLPKSTLLMLVSAFYDRKRVLEIYEEAVAEKYRFFSYGDAMLLL